MKNLRFLAALSVGLSIGCNLFSPVSNVQDGIQRASPSTGQPSLMETTVHDQYSPVSPLPQQEPIKQNSPIATPADDKEVVGGRQAIFPNTIIVYQQQEPSGSLHKWTFYHTGRVVTGGGHEQQISPGSVKALFNLAESTSFAQFNDIYGPDDECNDCLIHTIIIYGEQSPRQVIIVDNPPNLPQKLNLMLAELNQFTLLQ